MNANLADLDFGNLINHFISRRSLGDQSIATQINERFGHVVQVSRSTIRNWRSKSDTNIQDWKQLAAVAAVLDVSEEELSLLLKKGGLPTLEKLWSETSKEERALLQKWMTPAPLQSIDTRLETIASSVDEIRGRFPKPEPPTSPSVAELETYYRRAAAEEWAYLDIETGARVPLQQVYVMLEAMRSTRPSPVTERDDMAPSPERKLNAELVDQSAKTEPPRPMPLADVLNKHQHLVILGEAGAGKSTTLQSIALTLTGEQNQLGFSLEEERIPVLVRLREHEATLAEGVMESVLAAAVRPFLGVSIIEAQDLVERWRDGDRLAVLLDGLDELSENGRRQAFQAIRGFAPGRGETCRMIVTSRITGYQDLGEPLREFVLKPFANVADALPYATGWLMMLNKYGVKQADEAEKEAQALLKQMDGHPGLKRILDNPLFLRLALEIYVREQRLVHNHADLYQTAVEEIAWRRAEDRGIEFSKLTVVKALQCVAWSIHVEGKRQRSALIKVLGTADLGADPEALFEALRTKMGLILLHGETGDRNVAFSHKTFQEYLVAQRLAAAWQKEGNRGNAWAFLRPRLHHPDWHEPIFLMAGILAKEGPLAVTQFVKFIFKAQSPYEGILHRDLRLSVELMSSEIAVDDNIAEQIIPHIRQILSKSRAWLGFLRLVSATEKRKFLITALSEIGSERVTSILIPLLQDEDRFVRNRTVTALTQIGGKSAVAALQAALRNEDRTVRLRAAAALGHLGSESAAAALRGALQDEDSDVRGWAAKSLGQIGSETAVAALQGALQDEDSDVRGWVAAALGQIGSESAFDALQAALQHSDGYVRRSAAVALGQIGSESAVAALQAALQHNDGKVRGNAVLALEQIGSETAVAALQAAFQNNDSDVRGWAAVALGNIGSESAVAALQAALQHSDGDVRRSAAAALGHLGSESAVAALQAALQHNDGYVLAVALALARIGSESAVPALQAALRDGDSNRGSAARALGQIGSESAIPALQAALQDEANHVRANAVISLGEIGSESTVAALQAALQDEERYVREYAAKALGKIGSESAIPALQAALQDGSDYVRQSAVEALGQIGSESAVPALQAAFQHEDSSLCLKAVETLGEIGNESAIAALQTVFQHEDRYVRLSAMVVAVILEAVMRDEDLYMQWSSATLRQIGEQMGVAALQAALQHEDRYVRLSAVVVLGQIGSESALAALQAALQHNDSYVRGDAAWALGNIGSESALAVLQAAFQHESGDVRRSAAEALDQIGSEPALAALQAALQHEDSSLYRKAVEALETRLFSMSFASLTRLIKQLKRLLSYDIYPLFDKAIVRLTELQVEELKHTDPFTPPSQPPWQRTPSTIAVTVILGLLIAALALLAILSNAASGILKTEFEQALDVLSSNLLRFGAIVVALALLAAVLRFAANKLHKRIKD